MKNIILLSMLLFSSLSLATSEDESIMNLLDSGDFSSVETVSPDEFDSIFMESLINGEFYFKKRRKVTVIAKCPILQIQSGPKCKLAGQFKSAFAKSSSSFLACKAAKKIVNSSLPRGCEADHCRCITQ